MSGELNLIETLDNGQFMNALGQSEQRFNQHIGKIKQGAGDMDSVMKSAGKMIGTYFGATALARFAKQIVEVTGEFQQLNVAFTTILGSKEKAADLMGQMVSTAAKTPFTLQEVASGAKQLLAYQVAQEDVNDTLIRLGNISSGLGTPLSRLILVFGQVKAKGRLMGDDLRQFSEAGVPMIHELAKQMGIADKEVSALVTDGKIGFKEVENVLKSLTNEGGMFFNLMEAQSKTVTGRISNLKDKFTVMLNDIGSANTGVINNAISGATYLISNYETIGETIIALVGVYGTYRAALMSVAAAQGIVNASSAATHYLELNRSLGVLTLGHKARAVAIGIEAAAQEALNAISPYVLVATAIAAIVAAVWLLYDGTSAQERAQKALNKTLADARQKKDDLTSSTSELTGVINSETKTMYDRIKAYTTLQELYPDALKNMDIYAFKAMSATEQQKFLNNAINDMDFKSLDAQIKAAEINLANAEKSSTGSEGIYSTQAGDDKTIQTLKEYLEGLKKVKKLQQEQQESVRVAVMPEKERLAYYKQQAKELELQKNYIENTADKTSSVVGWVDKLSEKLSGIKKQDPFNLLGFSLDEITQKLSSVNLQIEQIKNPNKNIKKGTKAYWENEKKTATDNRDSLNPEDKTSKTDWDKYTAQILKAENKLKAWDDKTKDPKKITPFGTLEYYDEIIKKLKESATAYDSLSGKMIGTSLDSKGKPVKKGVDVTKQLEDLEEKRYNAAIHSTDEELNHKKQQYAAYYSMIIATNKEAADIQFADLKTGGKTYYEYLENKQKELKKTIDKGDAPKVTVDAYNKITEELNKINLVKDAWDDFTETMARLKAESKTTLEYLQKLEAYKSGVSNGTDGKNMTPEQRKTAVATIDQTTTKSTSDELNSLLDKYKTYNQQLVEIEAKKNSDIDVLTKGKTAKNAAEVDRAISLRKLQAGKEASDVGDAILKETALYKSLFGDLSNMSTKALLDLQKKGEDYLSGATKQTATDGTVSYQMPGVIDVNGQVQQQTISEQKFQDYVDKIKAVGRQVAQNNPFAKFFDDIGKMAKGAKIDTNELFGDVGGVLNDVNSGIDSARKSLDTMGLKLDEEDKKVMDDVQGMVSGAATLAMGIANDGDPLLIIKGSIELINSGIDLIWGANDRASIKAIAANEKAVKHLQVAYGQLKRAVDDAYGTQYFQAQAKVLENLQAQLKLEQDDLKIQQNREGKKYDQDAVDKATQQAQDTANKIEDIYKEMTDRIMTTTGQDFASSLGSSIFDAIASGANAFDVIDAKSKEVVQNIVKQWISTKIADSMKPMMDNLFNKITTQVGDTWTENDLNTPEAKKAFEDFQNGVKTLGTSYATILSQMGYLFDDQSKTASATGAIKGVSEQTAGYIEGNLTGIRLSQDRQETVMGATLKVSQEQLSVLYKINDNGTRAANTLDEILSTVKSSDNSLRSKGITP